MMADGTLFGHALTYEAEIWDVKHESHESHESLETPKCA